MTQKILIIGCGTAGAAATLMARKTNREAEITIIQDESLPEYSRCGLPYTVNRKIPELEDVIIHPNSFYTGKLVRDGEVYPVKYAGLFGGKISHELGREGLVAGEKVTGYIDWDRRYLFMRSHTACHLLSTVIFKRSFRLWFAEIVISKTKKKLIIQHDSKSNA